MIILIFMNHTYNTSGYKWTPQEVIDMYIVQYT